MERYKRKIFGAGVVALLLLLSFSTISKSAVSQIKTPSSTVPTTESGETVIWKNEKATGMYEVAYITSQLVEEKGPISDSYTRYFVERAYSSWGWLMFSLMQKGLLLFIHIILQ